MNELRDHLDIKDRKISVLQRKVGAKIEFVANLAIFAILKILDWEFGGSSEREG